LIFFSFKINLKYTWLFICSNTVISCRIFRREKFIILLHKILYGIFLRGKFITCLHKKYLEVKNRGETNKNIAPGAAGKINAELKNEKVSNPYVKKKHLNNRFWP
jgi:hypothetical protein